jgi:glycosyltransferase involved in cell wall biosynthesis
LSVLSRDSIIHDIDWAAKREMSPAPLHNDPVKPRVLFVGSGYAGHRTRFLNLQLNTQRDPRIDPTYHLVSGWRQHGFIEGLRPIPSQLRGRARATLEAAALAQIPRPDVIWTSLAEVAVPHLWSQAGRLRRPMVLDLDAVFDQLEQFAPSYYVRQPRHGLPLAMRRALERAMWHSVTLFTPWSRWVADGLRKGGVPDDRIHVLPPGIDLSQWAPRPGRGQVSAEEGPLKLLFVGGDFVRKGGPILLDLMRGPLAGRCTLDIVTREPVPEVPGVLTHRLEANDPQLRELYQRADLFVLPSQAECFGIAAIEAMASGLPVIAADLGGARDIVVPERTGWLIEPTPEGIRDSLEVALRNRSSLSGMGENARRRAEQHFDGIRNDRVLVELLLDQVARFRVDARRARHLRLVGSSG